MPDKKSAAHGDEQPSANHGDTPELKPATLDTFMKEQANADEPSPKKDVAETTVSAQKTTSDEPAEGTTDVPDTTEKTEESEKSGDADTDEPDFKTPEETAQADQPADAALQDGQTDEPEVQPQFKPVVSNHMGKWSRFKGWCGRHKVVVTILAILIVLGALAGIPWTRYKIGGLFLKQTISVEVMDSQTHKAVSSAVIKAKDVTVKTNNKGFADVKLPIGTTNITIEKTYYTSAKVTTVVPVLKPKDRVMVDLKATGRQVPITVLNSISGKPIENAVVMASETEGKTDKDGHVTMVLPTTSATVKAMVHADGYNDGDATFQVTGQTVAANTVRLVPSGSVYFLSNQSGKIDVVKTNLDGTGRKVVLAGTGKETPLQTAMIASRDWKYLALLSKRDGGENAKIYIIDTATGKITLAESDLQNSNLIGWSGHTLTYQGTTPGVDYSDTGSRVIKGYTVEVAKSVVLDQTQSETVAGGKVYTTFTNINLTKDGLVYGVSWSNQGSSTEPLTGKSDVIRRTTVDGKTKKDIRNFNPVTFSALEARAYGPDEVYFTIYDQQNAKTLYFEYEDGLLKTVSLDQESFYVTAYPTYLFSPSGSHTVWSKLVDGRHTVFVGDQDAKNEKQIFADTNYDVYGWYTEDYVLLSKNSSELYIMSVNGGTPHKISSYFKPDVNFSGYGYGYGGL
jgi:hypothetical protein